MILACASFIDPRFKNIDFLGIDFFNYYYLFFFFFNFWEIYFDFLGV